MMAQSYQVKALNFQDPESLQGQNSEDRFFLGD
jgi:hypothetical protein